MPRSHIKLGPAFVIRDSKVLALAEFGRSADGCPPCSVTLVTARDDDGKGEALQVSAAEVEIQWQPINILLPPIRVIEFAPGVEVTLCRDDLPTSLVMTNRSADAAPGLGEKSAELDCEWLPRLVSRLAALWDEVDQTLRAS